MRLGCSCTFYIFLLILFFPSIYSPVSCKKISYFLFIIFIFIIWNFIILFFYYINYEKRIVNAISDNRQKIQTDSKALTNRYLQ